MLVSSVVLAFGIFIGVSIQHCEKIGRDQDKVFGYMLQLKSKDARRHAIDFSASHRRRNQESLLGLKSLATVDHEREWTGMCLQCLSFRCLFRRVFDYHVVGANDRVAAKRTRLCVLPVV